jgi:sarcosine oxidase subunit beta
MSHSDGRVLIVGGGLIGCAVAWNLARNGARPTLVEQHELNSGASGRNAGSLHFQIERRFLESSEAGDEQVARTAALSAAAICDWRDLERELGANVGLHMRGGLMVAETQSQAALLELKVRTELAAGMQTQLLSGQEARKLCGHLSTSVIAAAYLPEEGHADPCRVTLAFARAAVKLGATVCTRTRVAALSASRPGDFSATLVFDDMPRTESFGQIVIAAGAWSPEVGALLNVHLPLFPVPLQMHATERTSPLLDHLIQHVGERLSMKQTDAGNILIGGGWPSRLAQRDGRFDLERRPQFRFESLQGNLNVARSIFPAVDQLRLLRTWTGSTAVCSDQLPIVGAINRLPGCYVAAGGSAFTLGPTFARLLSESLGGKTPELLGLTSPARFDHLNQFMGR